MGLIVKSTKEKEINLKGTPMKLESVYARVEFAARADGKTMEIAYVTYYDKKGFEKGTTVPTDLPEGNLVVEIEEGLNQDASTALMYMGQALKQQGYEVEITLEKSEE